MYDYHCSLLDEPLCAEDSTTYGVNFSRPCMIDNFYVVNQLSQDIMHVLLEGIIPYELTLMLKYFVIDEKYFTCTLLNDPIDLYAYSNQEATNKPSPIKPQILSASMTQSGKLLLALIYYVYLLSHVFSFPDVESCY